MFIFILSFFSIVCAQERKDTVLKFYDYKIASKKYELDFQKPIKNDSTLLQTLDSLKTIGFYTLTLDSLNNKNVYLNKGEMYKKIWVKNDSVFNKKQDWFAIQNLDSLVQTVNKSYAKKGYPFVEIKIHPLGFKDGEAQIALETKLFAARSVDGVQVQGYEKLSKGYIRNGLGLKSGTVYNESDLTKISDRMSYSPFLNEVRPPQTLFNTDSTTIYLYVEKVKSNLFDGILGFGNDQDGEFRLNGNVKIELNNNFNGMEKIRLNWIATPDKSTSLDLNVRVPYLFRSPIGTQTQLNMYRKDSVFVSTKLNQQFFYQITMNSNVGLNVSFENSSFVLEDYPELAALYDDFSKTGLGVNYEWIQPTQNRLLEGKTKVFLIGRTLNRKRQLTDPVSFEISDEKTQQYEVGLSAFHLFEIHPQHLIKARVEGYGLFGDDDYYSLNELYRLGGFNSIRGFNEESILASAYGIGSLEYRFLPNDDFYISAFGDLGFLENKSTGISENLIGTGIGLSFLTQLGIFNMSYAVGSQSDTGFDFKNSKIHFGILTRF